jgi:hypothetical protein
LLHKHNGLCQDCAWLTTALGPAHTNPTTPQQVHALNSTPTRLPQQQRGAPSIQHQPPEQH